MLAISFANLFFCRAHPENLIARPLALFFRTLFFVLKYPEIGIALVERPSSDCNIWSRKRD
jgi:hypothetical protein